MHTHGLPYLLLRAAAAFAFIYPPVNALQDPASWIGYFPQFMRILPDVVLLHGFGIVEVVIGLWILSGKKIFWPSVAATLILLAIVVFNISQMQVVFRDLSLAALTLALALYNLPRKQAGEKIVISNSENL